jgi:chromosome segregation protein
LVEKTSRARQGIKEAEEEIDNIEKNISKEVASDREKRQNFFEIERKLRIKQDELNRFKDKYNDSKIALAKVEVREEDLKKEVKDELKIDVSELGESHEQIDRASFEREIIKLKVKMEQIGGIDPMVQEEYLETSKRFEFLTNESQDLEKAIISLKDIIKEMDQKIGKVFADTFEEINKEFIKYFKTIFGGGQAHLAKIKVKNPRAKLRNAELEEAGAENEGDDESEIEKENESEEIGIEIFANPPGKKITNLSMLSGGERSLTSLALLFAIISHNPPPFSILDEVEAALDEANSKRFGRIITELSQNTQFIIITHNRETMRQASLLYGVTMSEDGISKLLSVRLDQVGQGGKIIK